ncbi:MAG TPA: ATP-dependent DNA ligase [Acidimicrobiia bacterium]|nr:ATP-dependent DNA ligase [Acidimicrobiia bacterium]
MSTLLAELIAASSEVATTSSRNAKTARLALLLQTLDPDELPTAIGLLRGEPRQGRIGIGYASAFGTSVEPSANPSLTVAEVDGFFDRLQESTGPGSQARRARLLGDLFGRATRDEQDFLRRSLTGEVRQGALAGILTEAVAKGFAIAPAVVRRASMLRADLGEVARVAATEGEAGLLTIGLQVLSPIQPMLASPGASIGESIQGPTSVEWKLDGARIQVHRLVDEVVVYTRNLNDITARMPEVVATAMELDVGAVVLDGEAMALRADGTPQPFQETMSRFGTEERAFAEVPVVPFFFDVLHLDGEDLIDAPLHERLLTLESIVPGERRVPRITTADLVEAESFAEGALAAGQEGIMIKDLESRYEAGRRGKTWRKVKPVHTYDLVVLAAEWGHGRRSGYLSNIHLGARDEANGQFVMVGKTFKGMTDDLLAWQTEYFPTLETHRDQRAVYLRPHQVVEVAIDGVQASTRYPGGVALRFARVKRYRSDKGPEETDTIQTLQGLLG